VSSRSQIDAVIDRYADGGFILAQAAAGLPAEHATARPGPGAWSLAELVAHLLDADLVLAERMKRVIAEDEPTLQAFAEDAWIDRLRSHEMPVDEAAELFAANRKWMARILRSLQEGDFARTGTHTEAGRQTLAEILAKTVNHLDHHLKFLYEKREAMGKILW
jgi:uncharacterized damage-inducible protein DinB